MKNPGRNIQILQCKHPGGLKVTWILFVFVRFSNDRDYNLGKPGLQTHLYAEHAHPLPYKNEL